MNIIYDKLENAIDSVVNAHIFRPGSIFNRFLSLTYVWLFPAFLAYIEFSSTNSYSAAFSIFLMFLVPNFIFAHSLKQ